MQTLARPITAKFPQETYAILKRRAKAEKMTLAQTVVALIEDALDEMSDEEDKRFSAICDERISTATRFTPLEEAMRKYDAL